MQDLVSPGICYRHLAGKKLHQIGIFEMFMSDFDKHQDRKSEREDKQFSQQFVLHKTVAMFPPILTSIQFASQSVQGIH
jgi:hypothetical protein